MGDLPLVGTVRLLGMLTRYEVLQHLRDPVTIALMVVMPVVVYPVVGWVGHRTVVAAEQENESRVLVVGQEPRLGSDPGLDVLDVVDHADAVASGRVAASARVGDGAAEIWWDSRSPDSADAVDRLRRKITAYRRDGAEIRVSIVDRQTPEGVVRGRAALVAPAMLCFSLLTAALYTALDVVTGERERGTLETLLVSARDRRLVAAAKFLVVVAVSLVGGLLSWTAGAATVAVLAPGTLGLAPVAIGALVLLPLAVLVSAVMMVGAAWAPDFKSGQVITLPLVLVPLLLVGVAALPGLVLTPAVALVPFAGVAVAVRDVIAGDAVPAMTALALGGTILHAALAVGFAARLLGREDVLLGARGGGSRRARGDFRADALAAFALAALALWFLGQPAQVADRTWGVVATQLVCVLPVAVLAPWWLGLDGSRLLRLYRPRGRDLLRGLMVGACLPGVALTVGQVQANFLPAPASLLAGAIDPAVSLPALLLVFSVLPAVCEELLFRGTFQGLWGRASPPWVAAVVAALAFGAIHASVFRLAPTATMGLLLGFLAIRAGSILPGMLAHAVNNGLVIVALHLGLPVEPGPWAWAAAVVGGVAAFAPRWGSPS